MALHFPAVREWGTQQAVDRHAAAWPLDAADR